MRFPLPLLFAASVAFPLPVAAGVADLQADLERAGASIRWAERLEQTGEVILGGVTITGGAREIEADRLSFDSRSGAIRIQQARFLEVDTQSGVSAGASEIVAGGSHALLALVGEGLCGSEVASGSPVAGLEISGLSTALARPYPTAPGAGAFTARTVMITMSAPADQNCVTFDGMSFAGVEMRGPDRSLSMIQSATLRLANGAGESAFDIDLQGFSTFEPDGKLVGSVGRVTMTGDLAGLDMTEISRDLTVLLPRLSEARSSFDLRFDGIHIEARQADQAAYRGDARLSVEQSGPTIDIALAIDLRGLLGMDLDLGLRLLPEEQVMGLSQLVGSVRGLALAERLSLARLRLRLEDRGLQQVIERATGATQSDLLLEARAAMNGVPAPVSDAAIAFIARALEGGAGFAADPQEPVALTQIVMTGLLQPALLETILSISHQ